MDEEFLSIILRIEEIYPMMNKHYKIRVEAWAKKLCQVTTNDVWKKNRNLYARILLNQVIKGQLSEPFDKRPPEGPLPKLNKYLVLNDQKENARPYLRQVQNASPNIQKCEQAQNQSVSNSANVNEIMLKMLFECRSYLESKNDPQALQLKQQQDEFFSWMQDQNHQNYVLEQIDEKTEENDDQQKDTLQFLQYLENFEKKTERLKQETEKYLKNGNF